MNTMSHNGGGEIADFLPWSIAEAMKSVTQGAHFLTKVPLGELRYGHGQGAKPREAVSNIVANTIITLYVAISTFSIDKSARDSKDLVSKAGRPP